MKRNWLMKQGHTHEDHTPVSQRDKRKKTLNAYTKRRPKNS